MTVLTIICGFMFLYFASVAIGSYIARNSPKFGEIREQGWWDVEHKNPKVYMYGQHIGSPHGYWQLMPPKPPKFPESLRG